MATPALLPDPSPDHPSAPYEVPPLAARPRLRFSSPFLHLFLFAVTLVSTTLVGMRYMFNFRAGRFPLASYSDVFPYAWMWGNRSHFTAGLPFSLTLLGILLTHEFGHYFACRYYGVEATLPFLLPAPSLSGTAGAIIRLRSRVNSRRALLAIGALGPLCGFALAVGTCVLGLYLSRPVPAEPEHLVHLAQPLLIVFLRHALGPIFHTPAGGALVWHPVLVASWIGILITSLNLIPAGQLDGGHIVYALSPRLHRASTRITMAVLVALGIFWWMGWLFWCALLLFPGMRHPTLQSADPLRPLHKFLAAASLLLFVLCATHTPFSDSSLLAEVRHFHW